jgi:hypothetical protein
VIRRIVPLLTAAILVAATAATVGRPDLTGVHDFMFRIPTNENGLAVIGLIVWMLVAGVVLGALLSSRSAMAGGMERLRHGWPRGLAYALAGLALLALGEAHHVAAGTSLCCGTITEATRLAS